MIKDFARICRRPHRAWHRKYRCRSLRLRGLDTVKAVYPGPWKSRLILWVLFGLSSLVVGVGAFVRNPKARRLSWYGALAMALLFLPALAIVPALWTEFVGFPLIAAVFLWPQRRALSS
jgi:hypothetical protein